MSTLEIKIKNLVEGLDSVTNLAKELTNVGQSAKAAGADAKQGTQGFSDLKNEADAYKTIGMRSFSEIRAEISRVTQAHEQLTNAGNLSGKELQAVTDTTKTKLAGLNTELKGVTTSNSEAAGAGGMLNKALGAIAPEASIVTSGLGFLKDNVGMLIGAFTALAVAYGLKESAEYAARTETLGITMNVVAKNAGYSAEEIGRYEKEVKGLGITTQGTREAITQMIQAGLEIGPTAAGQVSQVAKLARAAQDLAVVTGENSSATLTRLITNISQLDTVGLRYMGLTVNVEAAERQFALSIGKTVDQLTQKQKAQAVMDESLKQAEKLSGAYEASMESVGKKVQSLKRYQEELANDIGSKLLPAYAALVDAATNFLKEADKTAQGIDKSGAASRLWAEGVTSFGNAMGNCLNTVLSMFGEIYPNLAAVGKGFLDLLAFVMNVGTEILTLGHYTDDFGNKFTGLGQIIRFLLGVVALVLAGLKDGIDIVTATIYGLGGATIDIIGKMISAFGKMVSYVNKDLGKAIEGVGDGLQDTGKSMMDFADLSIAQFGRGESAVGKYRKALTEAALYQEKLNEVTDFTKAEAEVLKLAEAVRKNGTYTKDFADQSDALNERLKALQANGKLTTIELTEMQKKLQRLASDDVANFSKAVNDAGLKVVELAGEDRLAPLNKEFNTVRSSVTELGSSTKTTAAVMSDAFSKGIDAAKTLSDLNQIGASLGDVKKITGDIKPALIDVSIKFDELFEKALKLAKTDRDFADLRAEINRLKDAGVISGEALSRALKEIEEKSNGAEAAMSRLAKRAADIAKSEVDLARAHLDMIKAQADAGRASLDVLVKQNNYAKEGTALAREELTLAKLNMQLATEKANEAKAAYDVAIAAHKLLISLQQKLNAEKEAELHIGKEDAEQYKTIAKAMADQVSAAENALNWAREEFSQRQKNTIAIEEQVVQQKLAFDTVKTLTDQTKELLQHTDSTAKSAGQISTELKPIPSTLQDAGQAADQLAKKFSGITEEARQAAMASAEVAAQMQRTEQAIIGKQAAQAHLDAAQGHSPGVTSTASSGGVRDVKQEMMSDRNQRISNDIAESQKNTDAINHTATVTDPTIENLLWDVERGREVESTPENIQRAMTAFRVAEANLEMYQRYPRVFSFSGAASIMRSYNLARTLLEKVKGVGLVGRQKNSDTGSGGTNVSGSHRYGLDRVPHDGYVAELHKDEKVLTSKEADNYRQAPSLADISQQLLERIAFAARDALPAISQQVVKTSPEPSKTIQVNFTDEKGKNVPMTTNAQHENDLLDMLRRAKGVST